MQLRTPIVIVGLVGLMVSFVSVAVAQSADSGDEPQVRAPDIRALTLEQVLEEVREQNEEWEITESRIAQARAARREAWAALLPSLSVSGNVTRYGREIEFGGEQVRPQYDWGASGRASIAIFDGRSYPLLSRSGRLLEASEALSKWRRRSVVFEATQSFYLLAAAEEQVAIAERAIELRQAQLDRAQALVEAKLAIQLDVERARTQLLEAEQDLLEARAQLGDAADSLASLMAIEPEETLRAQVGDGDLEDAPVEQPPDQPRVADLEQRADFRAVEHQIEAVEQSERAVLWSLLPLLELRADAQAGPESAFSRPDGYTWSLTLQASWLLYDGGARYAQMDQLEEQVREERLSYQRELRQAQVGIRQALRRWKSAAASVDVARQQIQAARAAHESARERFDQGLGTNLEVIEAADTLFRAETALNQRRLDAQVAAAEYRYLVDLIGEGD